MSPIPAALVAGWGADLATSALGALGSWFTGSSQRSAQQQTNATNLRIAQETNAANKLIAENANKWSVQMQRENNEFNRQMAIDMFNLEKDYNSPSNMKKMMLAAGVNPYTEGSAQNLVNPGQASTPSAAGVPGVAVPTMQAAHMDPVPSAFANFFSNLKDFAGVFGTLSEAALSKSQKKSIEAKLQYELDNLLAQKENLEANTAFTKMQTSLSQLELEVGKKTKYKKAIAEIRNLNKQAVLAFLKGETEKSQKLFVDMQEKLASQEYSFMQEKQPLILEGMREENELLRRKQATETSQQVANYASAEASRASAALNRALAFTEDYLRGDRKENLIQDIKDKKFGRVTESIDSYLRTHGYNQSIWNLGGNISDAIVQRLRKILGNSPEVNEYLDWLKEISK